jgi:DNA polymerase-3 subunit epsilon
MDIIKVFYDLETTGVDVKKHSVHQIAGMIEINDEVVDKFNILSRPHPKCQYEEGALLACRKTQDELNSYPEMNIAHREFKAILGKYIDPFNTKQKAWNIGFNNRYFDDVFLRAWFKQNGDEFIGSWFWVDTIDSMVLASQYLIHRRVNMPSFKQHRVARELGIVVDESRLHDASYDVELTRGIYRITTGLDIEI